MGKEQIPKWERLLQGVVDCTKGKGLGDASHDYDWRRFYRFIIYCQRHGVHLGWKELRRRLEDGRVPEAEADKLARIYKHGRMILVYKSGLLAIPPDYLDGHLQ